MNDKWKKIVDIIQWLLIIILGIMLLISYNRAKTIVRNEEKIIQTETTYTKIYESQQIATLEKTNKELYDSIAKLKNAESAIKIKYIYKVTTDTITVEHFNEVEDSLYEYNESNDTISTNIQIKANDLKWCNVKTEICDGFTITNSNEDGTVTTSINHSSNMDIQDMQTWRKANSWKSHIYHGPSIGVGYGIFNHKPDLYIGYSIGYKF